MSERGDRWLKPSFCRRSRWSRLHSHLLTIEKVICPGAARWGRNKSKTLLSWFISSSVSRSKVNRKWHKWLHGIPGVSDRIKLQRPSLCSLFISLTYSKQSLFKRASYVFASSCSGGPNHPVVSVIHLPVCKSSKKKKLPDRRLPGMNVSFSFPCFETACQMLHTPIHTHTRTAGHPHW